MQQFKSIGRMYISRCQKSILLKILTQQVQHNDDRPISSKRVEQITLETGRSKDVQLLQISISISLRDERLEMRKDRQFESTKKPFRWIDRTYLCSSFLEKVEKIIKRTNNSKRSNHFVLTISYMKILWMKVSERGQGKFKGSTH